MVVEARPDDSAMTLPAGVNLMPDAPVSELVELAVLAERLGLRRCWVYDEGLATRDVYVTLTAIALATSSIRIGPGITNPYVRHPGATAVAVATLDELSGGRAFVGLGAGGGLTLDPLGIARRRPLAAVGETVAALRGLFAGETVDMEGEMVSLRRAHLGYGRADIEIIMAGRGPKMTALGGAVADGFNLSYVHKELLGAHAEMLRTAAGDRPFVISYSTMVAATGADREEARAALTFRLVDSPPEVKALIGMTDAEVESIRTALAAGGPRRAAELVRPEWIDYFVVTGSVADAGAELRGLLTTNDIDEFQLPLLETAGAAELIERTAAMFS